MADRREVADSSEFLERKLIKIVLKELLIGTHKLNFSLIDTISLPPNS